MKRSIARIINALSATVSSLALAHPALAASASASAAALAAVAESQPEQPGSGPSPTTKGEIIVLGEREVRSGPITFVPEDELSEADIATYGADSIGDLLDLIAADVDPSGEGPLVLVNGERITGIEEIADLPPEALAKVQLLARDAAGKLGENPDRRVINLQLKRSFRQANVTAERGFATAGEGGSTTGSFGYAAISGMNRTNVSLNVTDTELLLESDRPILPQPAGTIPFDLIGNLVPFPISAAEIDPLLSAAAGRVVTAAGLDGTPSPALASIAARAGQPNLTGIGDFRSLVPDSRNWVLNATLARRLGPRTSLSINANGNFNDSRSLSGAASAFVSVSPLSPFSPFSQTVGVARYLPVPLEYNRKAGAGTLAATLNQQMGKWSASVTANYTLREERTRSGLGIDAAAYQAAVDAGAFSPFAPLPESFRLTVREQEARGTNETAGINAIVNGPLARLPAGPLTLGVRGGFATSTQSTRTGALPDRSLSRDDVTGQITLDIPLASRKEKVLPALGDLRVNLAVGINDASGVGRLWNQTYGLTWSPVVPLNLRASFAQQDIPPNLESLNAPVITVPNVRFFDFIRNETVDVTIISGGNPDLPKQQRQTFNIGGLLALQDRGRLTLTADYSRSRNRNQVGGLPPLNAEVQAAFADRFLRDAQGRLIAVDGRPVSFAREDRQQLRWGINVVRQFGTPEVRAAKRLGGSAAAPVVAGEESEPSVAAPPGAKPWRLSLNVSHTWTLEATRQARAGLAPVDLLNGGALGYGGGQPRHTVTFNAAVGGKGVGGQVSGTWRDETSVRAGDVPSFADLAYAARALIDVRLFADLGTLLPDAPLAKGTRLSVSVRNIFDSQQRVTDGTGQVPLRFQPYLIDPLGRTIRVSVRKVF